MVAVHAFLALQNRLTKEKNVRFSSIQQQLFELLKVSNVKYLCLPALAATNVAELAASAAPVLFVLLFRLIVRRQAEPVKRLTAHLTVNHLENITNHIGINIHATVMIFLIY